MATEESFEDIDRERAALRLSDYALCQWAGVANSTLYRIRRGVVRPNRSTLAALARGLALVRERRGLPMAGNPAGETADA